MPFYRCDGNRKTDPVYAFNAYTGRSIKFQSLYCNNEYFSYTITGTTDHPTTITYAARKPCRLLYVYVTNGGLPQSRIMDLQRGQTISMTDTNTYYTYSFMTAYII